MSAISPQNFATLESATHRIGLKKMDNEPSSDVIKRPRMGTGGDFADLFLWDTAFTCMWAAYFPDLPVENSLDNFYRMQGDDGYIYRQYSPQGVPMFFLPHPITWAPPILTWAEMELYAQRGSKERLAKVYPHLVRHHAACQQLWRRDDELYPGCALGSGMDNLPRWPKDWQDDGQGIRLKREHCSTDFNLDGGWFQMIFRVDKYAWNLQGRYIDMTAQMALDAKLLAEMAELIGKPEEATPYRAEHTRLGELINERMWHEELGTYVDLAYGEPMSRLHIGGFWPLIAGIVPEERVGRLCDLLLDERHFNRPTPIPSLAASDPDYVEGGDYWLGGVWAPTNYMVMKGLAAVGAHDVARTLAEKFMATVWGVYEETETLWENYDPEKATRGGTSSPDFCGWTGLAGVSIPREFLA